LSAATAGHELLPPKADSPLRRHLENMSRANSVKRDLPLKIVTNQEAVEKVTLATRKFLPLAGAGV
jgi:hypothetical protein